MWENAEKEEEERRRGGGTGGVQKKIIEEQISKTQTVGSGRGEVIVSMQQSLAIRVKHASKR